MTKENSYTKIICNICGNKFYCEGRLTDGQVSETKEGIDIPQSWIHEWNLGNIGYGSFLDTSTVQLHVCDDCLKEMFKKMEIKPIIEDNYGKHKYGEFYHEIYGEIENE